MLQVVQDWGPETVLAVVVLMLLLGWLVPKKISDREMKRVVEYYEGRLKEKDEYHGEIVKNLRDTADANTQALMQAVMNQQRLVTIVDEYANLTRVATPALVARQQVLEGRNDA